MVSDPSYKHSGLFGLRRRKQMYVGGTNKGTPATKTQHENCIFIVRKEVTDNSSMSLQVSKSHSV